MYDGLKRRNEFGKSGRADSSSARIVQSLGTTFIYLRVARALGPPCGSRSDSLMKILDSPQVKGVGLEQIGDPSEFKGVHECRVAVVNTLW